MGEPEVVRRRAPRRVLLSVCAGVAVVSVVLTVVLSAWAVLVLPVAVAVGYGAWLGLRNDELLAVLDHGDAGSGPAGALP